MKIKIALMSVIAIIAISLPLVTGWVEVDELVKTVSISSEKSDLTDDDKYVKAEIAEYVETDVDFRHKKTQTFDGNTYDLTFHKTGWLTEDTVSTKVTYKSADNDEFVYNVKTGKLTNVELKSSLSRNADSEEAIDISSARVVADEFAKQTFGMGEYVLSEQKENKNGYMFVYSKSLYGYNTNDVRRVRVGYDGKINWAYLGNYDITQENLQVNKSDLEKMIKEVEESEGTVLDSEISVGIEGKVYFNVYFLSEDEFGNKEKSCVMHPIGEAN